MGWHLLAPDKTQTLRLLERCLVQGQTLLEHPGLGSAAAHLLRQQLLLSLHEAAVSALLLADVRLPLLLNDAFVVPAAIARVTTAMSSIDKGD